MSFKGEIYYVMTPPPRSQKQNQFSPPLGLLIIFNTPPPPQTKYNVTLGVEKLENRLRCLLSDNPACAGRFLREEYKPKPHDDCIIRPCKREANCILDKLHAMTENITKHDDSLFTEGGKPQTGLNCLHNFNNEKRHYIKSGVEKDVLHLVEDLDRVMAKYKANMKLAPGPQHLKQEKEKAEKKREKEEARSL